MARDKNETPKGDPPSSAEFEDVIRVSSDGPETVPIAFRQDDIVDPDQEKIWKAIRQHTEQIGFNHFERFVELALCTQPIANSAEQAAAREAGLNPNKLSPPWKNCKPNPYGFVPGTDLYSMLKLASEIFLLLRCGICPPIVITPVVNPTNPDGDDVFGTGDGGIPDPDIAVNLLSNFLGQDRGSYIRAIVNNVFRGQGVGASPFCPVSVGDGPCLLELIWSCPWQEESMLVQTTNAIALRFQNVSRGNRDPLAEFELDPLRPLSGVLWGYIQDESNRLSVARRSYEYEHHYGLRLEGKATAHLRAAESRSKFLQAFHDLLRITDQFYREAADHTVTPDSFPLLISLRDLHLILAEGAHNQFRDMPWTARSEMLVQQWLLARTEMREFLRGRQMVPYPEGWMGAVDAMKRLQGWSDTNVIHFRDLARFGERLLLSVRHVRWDSISQPAAAHDWALSWRPEVQGYIHAYRMATGVTLSDDVVDVSGPGARRYLQPSILLRRRLIEQRRGTLPAGNGAARLALPPRTRSLSRRS